MAQKLAKKYGDWALVTGASSGIGREMSRQLIARGHKVVLVARTQANLRALADELGTDSTRVVAADLRQPDAVTNILKAVGDLDIGLFAHIAGVVHLGPFLDQDTSQIDEITELSITATLRFAHGFGKVLKARGGGGLILTSSTLAFLPVPYMAAYAASKTFVLNFSEALAHELRPARVDVLALVPGGTHTSMADHIGETMDLSMMTKLMGQPGPVAAAALSALGRRDRVVPGAMNKVMGFMMARLMPVSASKKMFGNMMGKSLHTKPN